MNRKNEIENSILASSKIIKKSLNLVPKINESIEAIVKCVKNGNKVLIFGNGGSAADAQHIAAELIGKFKIKRKSYPALALTTNSSTITAIANDYSYDDVFSRQCESLVCANDVVIGISTSGDSKNVRRGLITAKKRGALTIGLLGSNGGKIKEIVDIPIIAASSSTARIQEVHRTIYHIICEMVEKELTENNF